MINIDYYSHKMLFTSKCSSFQHSFWVLHTKFATKWFFFRKNHWKTSGTLSFWKRPWVLKKVLSFAPWVFLKRTKKCLVMLLWMSYAWISLLFTGWNILADCQRSRQSWRVCVVHDSEQRILREDATACGTQFRGARYILGRLSPWFKHRWW